MQEGNRALALEMYRVALRSRCGTLRVHTAALGATLLRLRDPSARDEDLATAQAIHNDVLVRPRLCALA